jgi:5-methylcytosine-specific restriction endonuclease McrA
MGQTRSFKPRKTTKPIKVDNGKSAGDIVRELKGLQQNNNGNYREQSLKIHGLICAKCGREFDLKNKNLLTVHHKDGNHYNNPADGSNWENLCVYCHDDEHTRGILGDYLKGK